MSAPILTTAQNAALLQAQTDFDNGFTSGFQDPGGATAIVPMPSYQNAAAIGSPPVDYRPTIKAGFLAAMVNAFRYLYLSVDAPTSPTLINGWTADVSGTYMPVGYYRDPVGFVHLQGRIIGSTLGSFTLINIFCRPAATVTLPAVGISSGQPVFASVTIDLNGNVSVASQSALTSLSLDGLIFRVST
jgi:hypothetical protein